MLILHYIIDYIGNLCSHEQPKVEFIIFGCTRRYVYCKLFEVEKFCGFRRLIGDRETFPAKHFRSLECHGRTLQEEYRTVNAIYSWLFRTPLPLIRFHVSTWLARHTLALPKLYMCSGYTV